jgi:transcriptional regulator with XRE-family HTH domain
MLELSKIREALMDRNLARVAEKTGIHANTLRNIRSGANTNPTLLTLQRISEYLAGHD